ncbi:RES domain-containing protein [Rhizobium leguminosarum]|nr:RES domain-containing protein [Rhizobium leguminosarum]NKK53491.1 RES domain-containing protein [Rhizobium leguminosarum bv. viciae]MBY5392355.1 RES domain-containing protein [Rhizobium leguminosarum]MBY5400004.1 RES domain-containing protein [Rhizobium leguminosarum]MBY5434496.1 RES domain-containing protein [Rhizobium leguminosarum]NEK46112.1 RES domain-containing protein [Rhizobium leguminosarum]
MTLTVWRPSGPSKIHKRPRLARKETLPTQKSQLRYRQIPVIVRRRRSRLDQATDDNRWDYASMNVCYKCVGDEYLQAEIRSEGKALKCSFCEKRRKAFSIEELAERIQSVIEENYRPHQDEYGADSGEPVIHLIANLAQVDEAIAAALRAEISSGTYYDAFEGGYSDPFGREACYVERKPDTYDYQESWLFFRNEISQRSRYFSEHARRSLLEIFGDISSMRVWPNDPVIVKIGTGSEDRFLYRGRIAFSESDIELFLRTPVRELGPPPAKFAKQGRMNAGGISVFYGAREPDTCIAEVRAPVGSHVVLGRFEIIREIRLLDLDRLTNVYTDVSMFDPRFQQMSGRVSFFKRLVAEISRPVMPRDEESEYLVTQAVSEFLASSVEPSLDGIIFNSAQTDHEGRNIVLFNHACAVEPYELPPGTDVRVNLGWASDDDYDDSISIWEETPRSKPPRKAHQTPVPKPGGNAVNFAEILGRTHDRTIDEFGPASEPFLRLLIDEISIFRIRAVKYDRPQRRLSRHRHQQGDHDIIAEGEGIVYFAYGSNMDTPRLRFRTSGCKVIGVATLVGHELRFHKSSKDGSAKCDASWTGGPTDLVVGVLYNIPMSQKAALDKAEGLGQGYDEATITVMTADAKAVDAVTYLASDEAKDDKIKPYQWYKDFVERGAREHELPEAYIQRFIVDVDAVPDPDEKRESARREEVAKPWKL